LFFYISGGSAQTPRPHPAKQNTANPFRGSEARGRPDWCLDDEKWTEERGYERRWAVEAYSAFKRTFSESVMTKTRTSAVKELAAKAAIYNMLMRI